jgi:bifunctional non-homologous end joining protein LigD
VLCRFDGKRVTLISRNGKSQDFQFPDVVAALTKSLKKPVLLDGEIVCLDARGRSSFRALQQRFHLTDAGVVATRATAFPAYLYIFDVLYFDRFDVTGLELRERKSVLKRVLKWSDRIRWTEATPQKGIALLRRTCREAGEGIVGKRLDSRYIGGRSEGWVKIKCAMRQEFVIGGFTDPQRSRVGLGALLVGFYDDLGRFTYAGKVGTGYTKEVLLELRDKLGRIESNTNPFAVGDPPRGDHVHWVRPKFVAEIGFAEWTQNGLLRQPRFEGLREDKSPRQVRRERPTVSADQLTHKG